MKNQPYPTLYYLNTKNWFFIILLLGCMMPLSAQTGEEVTQTSQPDTVAAEEAAEEKTALRLSFEAFKINGEVKLLARVRTKVKAKFQNTFGVEVSFFGAEVSPEYFIGKDTTDHKGEATWMLGGKNDSVQSATYWAVVQNHPDYEDAEETTTVNPSVMELTLEEVDSSRLVKLFIGYPDESGAVVPLAEAECNIYVQRLFGLMPITESAETTDEEGNLSIEFPAGVAGDPSGNLTVVAKIAEHEIVGNVEASKTIAWGISKEEDDFYKQRQLWSARSNSPIALIFVVNLALLGIWGAIAFIFLEIFRINRLGKTN